jgi:hypothetical protein
LLLLMMLLMLLMLLVMLLLMLLLMATMMSVYTALRGLSLLNFSLLGLSLFHPLLFWLRRLLPFTPLSALHHSKTTKG